MSYLGVISRLWRSGLGRDIARFCGTARLAWRLAGFRDLTFGLAGVFEADLLRRDAAVDVLRSRAVFDE